MSRQRYEPIPQRPRDEVILLDNIYNSQSYNYNSGVPNSVASSTHTPSILAPSIPSSPPPSFHTHSSPGTPRPPTTRSRTSTRASQASGPSYAELWGVAPSTTGQTENSIGTSNDALATITSLKMRVEWLEESIGRLLLERENEAKFPSASASSIRDNCCVTFTDASPDLERAITSGSNCCVSFRSHNDGSRSRRKHALKAGLVLTLLICAMVTVIVMDVKIGSSASSGSGLENQSGIRLGN